MEKKQSSIDYLIEQLEGENNRIAMVVGVKKYNSIVKEAKAMHKEEITDAYCKAGLDIAHNDSIKESGLAQEYYNETFGGEQC